MGGKEGKKKEFNAETCAEPSRSTQRTQRNRRQGTGDSSLVKKDTINVGR
jgi:hypothetical protein